MKGAQFIDLVGLGMKDNPNDKPKADAVYIKPNVNVQGQFVPAPASTFQPMAHLNEQ